MNRLALLVGVAALLLATTGLAQWKNLRVLPENISPGDLESLMTRFGQDLGVTCAHCHESAEAPESDARPTKDVARRMLRMTLALNRDYFDSPSGPMVTCRTCHRGEARPPVHRPPVRPPAPEPQPLPDDAPARPEVPVEVPDDKPPAPQ